MFKNILFTFTAFTAFTVQTVLAVKQAPCSSICVRKEIHDVTDGEWRRFVRALKQFNKKDESGISGFDRFSQTHGAFFQGEAHMSAEFLPWHRALLSDFESKLQEIDPTVCVPYWDWALEYDKIPQSFVWSRLGRGIGRDRCIFGGDLADFPIKNSVIRVPFPNTVDQYCITRNLLTGDTDRLPSPASISQVIKDSQLNYGPFASALENIHLYLHITVGGDMDDRLSPSDLTFYLHHAFIDKVWSDFQNLQVSRRASINMMYNGKLRNNGIANINRNIAPFNATVYNVMNNTNICVHYAQPGEMVVVPTGPTATVTSPLTSTTPSVTDSAIDATSTSDVAIGDIDDDDDLLSTTQRNSSTRAQVTIRFDPIGLQINGINISESKIILPENVAPPTEPLKPLPLDFIKKMFDNKEAKSFEDLPPEAQRLSIAGTEVSSRAIENLGGNFKSAELLTSDGISNHRLYSNAILIISTSLSYLLLF